MPERRSVEDIALMCHEMNRLWCELNNDFSQPTWADAPEWQRSSAINGVKYHQANPDSKPADSHISWMLEKVNAGWKFGLVKDPVKKTHPCIVPYDELPLIDKVKDSIFVAIAKAFE